MAKKTNKRNPAKTFVLDTNVLLHDPNCIYKFEDNRVVLTMQTLCELDSKKSEHGSIGRAARQVNRDLRKMFGPLMGKEFVGGIAEAMLPTKGSIMVLINPFLTKKGTPDYFKAKEILGDPEHPDNKILLTAKAVAETTKPPVIFVTKDSNAALKAMMIGLQVEDYLNDQVADNSTDDYYPLLELSEDMFLEFRDQGSINLNPIPEIEVNDYVIVAWDGKQLAARHAGDGRFVRLITPASLHVIGDTYVTPKNIEQAIFLDALLDPKINLVTAIGKAGTGKTLLALAAALSQILKEEKTYSKLLITRSIVQLGKDMGALPGSKEEKLNPFLQPYYDNLEVLLGRRVKPQTAKTEDIPEARPGYISRKAWRRLKGLEDTDAPKAKEYFARLNKSNLPQPKEEHGTHGVRDGKDSGKPQKPYQWLLDSGILELEAMAYVRGRSIQNSFLILDEAQNLTPHEIKTLVTRAAEGTKIVLIGDPAQIDTPMLDANSNGLVYARKRMRGAKMAATVKLIKSVRSELAEEAAQRL